MITLLKRLLHRISHLLNINGGFAYSWLEGKKLKIAFKCATCGELSDAIKVDNNYSDLP